MAYQDSHCVRGSTESSGFRKIFENEIRSRLC